MAAEPTVAVVILPELPAEVQRAIAKVRAKEASARDAAMFDIPQRCGPFRLRQILPHDALLFYAVQNSVFRGRDPAACPWSDLFDFVARLSRAPRAWVALRLVIAMLRAASRKRLFDSLAGFIDETFIDWPSGSSEPQRGDRLKGSFLSHIFHLIASTYHWPESVIAAIPVRRLLLYRKHIEAAAEAAAGRNFVDISHEERRIKAEWMQQASARGGQN